jgi:hypothetical protein
MYEHGEPSEGFLVVYLSSGEENATSNTSWDEEITHRLFGDLNSGLLGLPGDGHIIVLSDSEEEEEVCEDDDADTKVGPSCTRNSLVPTASAVVDAPDEVQDDSSDGRDEAGTL